jgi:hypothetical protein
LDDISRENTVIIDMSTREAVPFKIGISKFGQLKDSRDTVKRVNRVETVSTPRSSTLNSRNNIGLLIEIVETIILHTKNGS